MNLTDPDFVEMLDIPRFFEENEFDMLFGETFLKRVVSKTKDEVDRNHHRDSFRRLEHQPRHNHRDSPFRNGYHRQSNF